MTVCCGQRMTLQMKVAALREFFGLLEEPLLAALAQMREVMGLQSEGSLPEQVDKLVRETGVGLAVTTPVALPAQVSPVTAQTPSPAAATASHPSSSKRKLDDSSSSSKRKLDDSSPMAPDQKQSRQLNLFQVFPNARKTTVTAQELQTQRDMAACGQDYRPKKQDLRTFESEKPQSSDVVKPIAVYTCCYCPRTFRGPAALATHMMYHSARIKPKIVATAPPQPPPPRIELRCTVDGAGRVSVSAEIEGTAVEEIEAGRVAAAKADAERQKLQSAEANRRQRKREAEDEAGVEDGEHRGGSAQRHSYDAKTKFEAVDVSDRIYLNSAITNKGEAWADRAINPKFYGVPFGNLCRWRKPVERRKLAVAVAQTHASTLLRIDKDSRRVGKYAEMEKELFKRFKARRARARKASPRWLTHMAR